jgi:hypothetical protein
MILMIIDSSTVNKPQRANWGRVPILLTSEKRSVRKLSDLNDVTLGSLAIFEIQRSTGNARKT